MDVATLQAHRALWGSEEGHQRFKGEPMRLSAEEHMLLLMLRDDVLGERIRMEQERLSFGWGTAVIGAL